ncbi:MAG: hypothetical protein ACRD0U_15815 [Acidimicrobiales bacterium]
MRLLRRFTAYAQILRRGRRNRTDLTRYLIRRPALLAGIGVYETATILSNRVEPRLKNLAGVKASSLIGCPF